MVHSLPVAGGSHQRALTATPLSRGRTDGGREGEMKGGEKLYGEGKQR